MSYISLKVDIKQPFIDAEKSLKGYTKYGEATADAMDVLDMQEMGGTPELARVWRYYLTRAWLIGYEKGVNDTKLKPEVK